MSDVNTLAYYNQNADAFVNDTQNVCMGKIIDDFLMTVPDGGRILDFGCGSGRDSKYFLDNGFEVDAIDGSEEMCRRASAYIGQDVACVRFQDYEASPLKYDGIWACASLLHLKKEELPAVFGKLGIALKPHAALYVSFKYGDYEGERDDRYYTDLTVSAVNKLAKVESNLKVEHAWITGDVRPGRETEAWLNAILRKTY